jgi:hypothetical protein
MGRQHVRDGAIHVRQQKTGSELAIPISAVLADVIDSIPADGLIFLTNDRGAPFTSHHFGDWFSRRCDEAGLGHCSAHGLRKAAARRLAEAGCTELEIKAITEFAGGRPLHEGRQSETVGEAGDGQDGNVEWPTFQKVSQKGEKAVKSQIPIVARPFRYGITVNDASNNAS